MKVTKRARDIAEVIALVDIKVRTVEEAADELGRSGRTIKRYLKKFREEGIEGLNYHGHEAWNRTDNRMGDLVVELKNERSERSCPHIKHLVYERTGKRIPRSTVWRILNRRREDLIEGGGNYAPIDPIKPYEMKRFGEMWQIDTCEGYWLKGYGKIYLILLVDDHSRGIVAGRFALKDDAVNNMLVIREGVERYDAPHTIKADNDSKFKPIRKKDKDQEATEIQRACSELSIVLFTHKPYNAKSKGKIEKRFPFIENWFIKEHEFRDLEDLNSKFQEWIEWFNTNYVVESTKAIPKSRFDNSAARSLPEGINLDDIFCFKDIRRVRRDAMISYKGDTYEIGSEYIRKKVELHVVPYKDTIRIWYAKELVKVIDL